MNLLDWHIDYAALLEGGTTMQEKRNLLGNGVTDAATDVYKKLIKRQTLVDTIQYCSFWYGFDNYSWLELKGRAPLDDLVEIA